MEIEVLLQGAGFVIGGAVMWVVFKMQQNDKDHANLMKALEKHAQDDGAKLDRLCDKLDILIELFRKEK